MKRFFTANLIAHFAEAPSRGAQRDLGENKISFRVSDLKTATGAEFRAQTRSAPRYRGARSLPYARPAVT